MGKFFHDVFIETPAIFTVFGSKPLSFVEIICATEEEWKTATMPYLKDESEKEKTFALIEEHCREYDLPENWDRWVNFIKKHPNSPFLFLKQKTNTDKIFLGHVLNVQEMVWLLTKNHSVFQSELGRDFDPISVTFEFSNPESEFWKGVFANHRLMGLAYGYGEKNAYFFAKEMNKKSSSHSLFASLPTPPQTDAPSISNLRLPSFRSYTLPFNQDPIREKYEREKKLIETKLNKQNFFNRLYQQLTGELK